MKNFNRTLAVLAMASTLAMPRARAEKTPDGVCLLPVDRVHNTDWFHDDGWGLFVHYLFHIQNAGKAHLNSMGKTTSWDECVNEFDTEKFAEQVQQTGAKYVFVTMMQITRYLIAPNDTYDRLTGYKPGEACSHRDLVLDLYQSLHKRNITLMLYWTGDGPRTDAQASKGLGYGGGTPTAFVKNWAAVAAEYGERYKDKVAGYWVDGCYGYTGYNQEKWTILANGLRAGNPKRIIGLNNPSMVVANSSTLNDDFTTGEVDCFGEVPTARWRDGVQFHVLSFLGGYWGAPGVRFSPQWMAKYIRRVNANGGVITSDVMLYRDGSIEPAQVKCLAEMSQILKTPEPAPIPLKLQGAPVAFGAAGEPGRDYERTVRGDFANSSFQAEITVTVKGGGGGAGSAFFGLGRGEANFAQFDEPSVAPSVFCLLAPSDFAGALVTVSANSTETGREAGAFGDGTHRVRLTWDASGKRALFEVCKNWDVNTFKADSSLTVDASKIDFGGDGHLFAGGANGVTFADLTVKELSDSEIKAVHFGDAPP